MYSLDPIAIQHVISAHLDSQEFDDLSWLVIAAVWTVSS
jgi:hypothetical protein